MRFAVLLGMTVALTMFIVWVLPILVFLCELFFGKYGRK